MKTILVVTFLLGLGIMTIQAQNVGALVVGVKALDNTVNMALNKADNVLSDQQRALFVNIANYTAYLTGNLKSLTDDINRNLTQKELAILNDVNTISTKLNASMAELLNGIENGSTIIENSAARVIGSDKSPAPTFYKIPIITTAQNKNITIDVKGVRINNNKNFIVFKGKTIPVTSISSDKLISFTIPLTEADLFNSDTINTFDLSLFKKRFLRNDKEYKFNPKFVVAPQFIGTVKVFYKVEYKGEEASNGQTDIVHATSGSNTTVDVPKQFNIRNSAADGWKIDKASITCWKESGNGDRHGYAGPYPNTMTNISFVAKAYARDGHAVCRCNWNEYRLVTKDSIQTSNIRVDFNKQYIVPLPQQFVSLFKTEVTYYDKAVYETAKSSFKNNYIEFTLNQLNKSYEVKFTKD